MTWGTTGTLCRTSSTGCYEALNGPVEKQAVIVVSDSTNSNINTSSYLSVETLNLGASGPSWTYTIETSGNTIDWTPFSGDFSSGSSASRPRPSPQEAEPLPVVAKPRRRRARRKPAPPLPFRAISFKGL